MRYKKIIRNEIAAKQQSYHARVFGVVRHKMKIKGVKSIPTISYSKTKEKQKKRTGEKNKCSERTDSMLMDKLN